MKKRILFVLFCVHFRLFAQNPDSSITFQYFPKVRIERVVSMNMTPLLTQLIPFNRSNPLVVGPYMVNFKRYRHNRGLRWGLGANFGVLAGELNNQNLNFHIGRERRKRIVDRFAMYYGFDVFLSLGGFNFLENPNSGVDEFFEDFNGGLGIGPVWGFEYALNKNMSISTETALHIPIISTLGLFVLPPVGINLNYRFFKN